METSLLRVKVLSQQWEHMIYGCLTCVGVYSAIDHERCFIADIKLVVRLGNSTALTRFVIAAEDHRLKAAVAERLQLAEQA